MTSNKIMTTVIDHITVVAPDLASGSALVTRALGVTPRRGGAHPRMGTHNLLLRLSDSMFLEVIAPDPNAVAPSRPRWFELDRLSAQSPPRLATWVARTDDIHAASAPWVDVIGVVEPMTRGSLNWLITVPPDGSLPMGGAAPALIQWNVDRHPASTLEDVGCSLIALDVFHTKPRRVQEVLDGIALSGPVRVHARAAPSEPCLIAHIQTPSGLRALSL
jgi:hypothetical protein